jgi:hypothetical protein
MKQVRSFLFPLLAGSLLAVGSPASGAPKKKPPSPSKQLKSAYTKINRAKSYRVSASIVGGVSDNEQHKMNQRTVAESYEAEVYRKVMHVTNLKAYRTPKKGTLLAEGVWKNLLADRDGKKCDRLFPFPEVLLVRALRYARAAKWVKDPDADPEEEKDKPDKPARGEDEEEVGESSGRTEVAGTAEDEDGDLPRYIRVDTPVKEALTHVLEVESSGCLSGG